MDPQNAIELSREAINTGLLICSPLLLVGMLLGLLLGLLQALTQIQDQTVAFVPKLVAMILVLSFCMPWLIQHMLEYTQTLFANIPKVISGG